MALSLSALLSLCFAVDPYHRAVKIVDQMTLEEKFSLIQGAGHTASGGGTYVGVIKGLYLVLFAGTVTKLFFWFSSFCLPFIPFHCFLSIMK